MSDPARANPHDLVVLVIDVQQQFVDAVPWDCRPELERIEQLLILARWFDIPILATVPSDLFGVVIATRDGKIYTAGETKYEFSIQSVSKPFTASLIMQEQGPASIRKNIGVEPTGLPFNSRLALEIYDSRSVNPMVNAGAIAAVSLVEADSEKDRWNQVSQNINDYAGRELSVLEEVYNSEYETSWGNRAIANLLYNYERLYADPEESLRVYTRQ